MLLYHKYSPVQVNRKVGCLQATSREADLSLLTALYEEILFANSGSGRRANKVNKDDEQADESGLLSSARTSLGEEGSDTSQSILSSDDSAGATGPGSDKKGDKMPGEDGIGKLTDGIANFIDKAEDDDKK